MFLKTKLYLYLYLVSVFGLSEFTELLKPPPLFHGHVSAVGVNVSAGGASVGRDRGLPCVKHSHLQPALQWTHRRTQLDPRAKMVAPWGNIFKGKKHWGGRTREKGDGQRREQQGQGGRRCSTSEQVGARGGCGPRRAHGRGQEKSEEQGPAEGNTAGGDVWRERVKGTPGRWRRETWRWAGESREKGVFLACLSVCPFLLFPNTPISN